MGAASYGSLPFKEQIAFFRRKLNLSTHAWTDIWQGDHDAAFVVAGANRDDLVADFRAAVDRAIADGATLQEFRNDFDAIVAKYGWSYNGSRGWRSRVIYETNMRTSYAAGRYAQLKSNVRAFPLWQYRHSLIDKVPRVLHVTPPAAGFNGLVLRHDDPWWDVYFPPNGWGCTCYVRGVSDFEVPNGPDQAPPIKWNTTTVGTRGPSPRSVQVAEGTDPGWSYAPGRDAWLRNATDQEHFNSELPPAAGAPSQPPPLPEPHNVPPSRLLAPDTPLPDAVDRFLAEFGATREAPAVFYDAVNDPQIISDAFFKTRSGKEEQLLVERVPYFLLYADTIKDPDEIRLVWVNIGDGMMQLRKRYIRRVIMSGETVPGLVVVELGKYGWTPTTAFAPSKLTYLDRQRLLGELLYIRNEGAVAPPRQGPS